MVGSRNELDALQAAHQRLQEAQEELRATQAITEGQHRYQELFELAPDGYVVTNRHGRIREANSEAARILNVPPHYLIDKPLTVYVDSSTRSRLFSMMQCLLTDKSIVV
jgi:PAS domain S-box-containing protein